MARTFSIRGHWSVFRQKNAEVIESLNYESTQLRLLDSGHPWLFEISDPMPWRTKMNDTSSKRLAHEAEPRSLLSLLASRSHLSLVAPTALWKRLLRAFTGKKHTQHNPTFHVVSTQSKFSIFPHLGHTPLPTLPHNTSTALSLYLLAGTSGYFLLRPRAPCS